MKTQRSHQTSSDTTILATRKANEQAANHLVRRPAETFQFIILKKNQQEMKEIGGPVGDGAKRSYHVDETFISMMIRKYAVSMSTFLAVLIIAVFTMWPGNIEGSSAIVEEELAMETPRKTVEIPALPLDRDQLPIDEKTKGKLIDKWGQWHFWDGDEEMRPKEDYCSRYPNRDIPGDSFPDGAWQVDAVYVNHYLNDADKLISRAMEAIFTEYGKGKPLAPEKLAERHKMFHWVMHDLAKNESPPPDFSRSGKQDIGGWTTKRSFDGLVRRLLHAMITQDTFTVVLAGHSAAKGEGNHFRQSYMMQFHKVMRPIFERLGVKLITRNISHGGMSTIQGAMGSAGIYGDEIDLLLWDSGMTERVAEHTDLFFRQALIAGKRVPVVWGAGVPYDLLRMLHEEADADVGEFGKGTADLPVTENEGQMMNLPWAYQGMKCLSERKDLCEDNKYRATCWIDRPDGIKPKQKQPKTPSGQVSWHPGWRAHQLHGRVIAFAVLEALQAAINTWSEATLTGQPLDESYWHVSGYYDNIRNKVRNLDKKSGSCEKIKNTLPARMCYTPMQGRTQYTPRAHPEERSISALIKPAPDGYVPRNMKVALYEGPDVHIPNFDLPKGAVDVLAIIENRRRLEGSTDPYDTRVKHTDSLVGHNQSPVLHSSRRHLGNKIIPGNGWEIFGEPQGYCDGTYEAVCGRSTDGECILAGHHDYRGAVIGNEFAGWLVMKLTSVKEGIIVIKLHTWHFDEENTRTVGWEYVNNDPKDSKRRLRVKISNNDTEYGERHLKMRSYSTPDLPETFMFEYAINGKITTLDKAEFLDQKKQLARVVETLTLLDDENFLNGEAQDLELAVRMRGCGRSCVFGVSHIYWA